MFNAIDEVLADLEAESQLDETLDPAIEVISTTLPAPAHRCYQLFCAVDRIPTWLSNVRSVQLLSRDRAGRPREAAFVSSFHRASVGYTLRYRYRDHRRLVSWSTPRRARTSVRGRAKFIALSERATMLHYQLNLDLPRGALDPQRDGHTASAAVNDFRDFVSRMLR